MAQFNFGSNAGNTAATPNFGFGSKPAVPSFGSLAHTQPSGSITFGTPIASVAPTPQNTGLNFGATTPGPSLNFGAQASSIPTTGLAFGAQTPKTTGLTFGTPAPTSNLTFGVAPNTTAPNIGLSFGNLAPSAPGGLAFGTPASSVGFTLGTGTATSTGLFGTPIAASTTPSSAASGGLAFGAPSATQAATGFTLGTSAGTTGFSLGATTTSASGLAFGAPAATSASTVGLAFGAPAVTSASTTGLNFGLGGTSAVSTAPTLNFKSSSYTPATTTPLLNFGLGSSAKITSATSLTLTTPATQATSVGLGGVDNSLTKDGAAKPGGSETLAAKENLVPNEILQSIETFKTFVKDQKTYSSDVSRGSARPFLKVSEDIDLLNTVLSEVGNELQRHQQVADKLKYDSAKCLHNAEMAQRTNDTPPGLQFENTAPVQYFIEIVNGFEQDLQALRLQIDITDKHIQSLHEPRFLTSQELALGMRRLHDTFVALAGRLQSVHTQVESQKEQYLNLRKYILKDPTNIFKSSKTEQALDIAIQSLTQVKAVPGPTPFSSLGSNPSVMMMASQQAPNKPPPAYPAAAFGFSNTTGNQLSSGTLMGAPTNPLGTTSLFGNTSGQIQSPATDNANFQLQNPPLGNKRGKR